MITLEQKNENLQQTINGGKPQYVPIMANVETGIIGPTGLTIAEATKDIQTYIGALSGVYERFYCDCAECVGISSYPPVFEAIRSEQWKVANDGVTIEHLQKSVMEADEYPEFIADLDSFIKNKILPRKYPWMFNGDIKGAAKAIEKMIECNNYYFELDGAASEAISEKFNIIFPLSYEFMMHPAIDEIFDYFRGFVGTIADLRRKPKLVKEASNILWKIYREPLLSKDLDPGSWFSQVPHMPSYLNRKQFEEFYWPQEKQIVEYVERTGNKILIILEGSWKHVVDMLTDLPKNSMLMIVDDDDIFDVKKAIGNTQVICGGAKLSKLLTESKDSNIDYAKRIIDECAADGGFIFTTDKCWACKGDINQNLFDIYNYAHEYGRY